jgi:hypothetical protein
MSPWPKLHLNLKPQEEILSNSSNSNPRCFSEFSFKIHFEYEEVSTKKVVPFFKLFIIIIYFKFFELKKVPFGLVEVCIDLKLFRTV